MALVAMTIVAIISMAALSIDIGTLYEAKAEAQRAADAAALTAARVISISGITGDPANATSSWQLTCGGTSSPATLAAISVAQTNLVSGIAVPTANVTVNYGAGRAGGASQDCSSLGRDFGVNPTVTVTLQSSTLPIFFARIFSLVGSRYSGTTVSATATAEVFNSSDSGTVASQMIPVQPRCVKPLIVANKDPGNGVNRFVHLGSGAIFNPGVKQLGKGVIGENFNLGADCKVGAADCEPGPGDMRDNPPTYNGANYPNVLEYVPALISGTPVAVSSGSSCSLTAGFQSAVGGCDQNTVYACGTLNGAQADLTENPVNPSGFAGDTSSAVQCLINSGTGQDALAGPLPPNPPNYPFQIQAGAGSPLVQAKVVTANDIITTSNSIVTLPIANFPVAGLAGTQPIVTIVGFLQVFINQVNPGGSLNVTVMNVVGCSDTAAGNPTVTGTSPVPIRLITPP
ncbi:MAG: pilus assembly protein TadG-related protein [Candidatus Sulfotelmatobacter sp.]|jgi:hypothetical protein